ncbi:MAG: metal-dependent hydrolase [Nanoarchaeota archaeon]|nr:metal-dependent hydrolase [Nanoarchaeota archaeon]MBU4299983.1 metal-dependent hydrolase [Nanoarchaeota archaeon]MBU4451229.1 metal-dependent hydrolase [Nanoarchaeota archaeon]
MKIKINIPVSSYDCITELCCVFMDGVTHALFPFLARKYFKRNREKCAALLLGGLAQDIDIFLSWIPLFFNTLLLFYHRGITHTFIFGFLTGLRLSGSRFFIRSAKQGLQQSYFSILILLLCS